MQLLVEVFEISERELDGLECTSDAKDMSVLVMAETHPPRGEDKVTV